MKVCTVFGALVVLLAVSAHAQQPQPTIVAEGGQPDDRASARVLYWNTNKNAAAGQFAINYGRPVWKSVYDDTAKFDALTIGKVWRMGSNFWTVLDTCLPLRVSGREVPIGQYYLGLHRSADGSNWSLAFIDPGKVRAAHLDAFDIQKANVEFEVPMSIAKTETKAEKLTITLSYPKENIRKVTLKLAWGNLVLTAPIDVNVMD
ncbi:MAG: DUF2911 domain-containing protein [Acidobacteriia bacterium]|nr:DUF2911 domain-containing protein [Terriglobia bacterium]